MQILDVPPIFRNFSTGTAKVQALAPPLQSNEPKAQSVSKKTDAEVNKKGKKHSILKTGGIILGTIIAASFIIPATRKGMFGEVDPKKIDMGAKGALTKKGLMEFADQVKAKRNLTGQYILGRFSKVKEIIRRNFFSYNQEMPEKLTPIKRFPQKLLSCITNEYHAFVDYIKKMCKPIEVAYKQAAKNLP